MPPPAPLAGNSHLIWCPVLVQGPAWKINKAVNGQQSISTTIVVGSSLKGDSSPLLLSGPYHLLVSLPIEPGYWLYYWKMFYQQ